MKISEYITRKTELESKDTLSSDELQELARIDKILGMDIDPKDFRDDVLSEYKQDQDDILIG